MAYQSEIELRVKVLDKDLRELEAKLKKLSAPQEIQATFKQVSAVRSQKAEAELLVKAEKDLERLAETKERKSKETNIRRLRFLRRERLENERQVERKRLQVENRIRQERLKTERLALKAQREAEKVRSSAKRKRDDITSNLLIGGAFPLLFGQGLGAAAGGALGGGIGGALGGQFGFAGSLIGTALGQAIDNLVAKTAELGNAFNKLDGIFETLKNRSLISSESEEKRIEALKKLGLNIEAEIAALQDFSSIFGPKAIDNLKDFGKEFSRLISSFARFATSLGVFIAGPLAKLLKAINDPIQEDLLKKQLRIRKAAIANEAKARKEQSLGRKLTIKEEQQLNTQLFSNFTKKSKKAYEELIKEVGDVNNLSAEQKRSFLTQQLSFLGPQKETKLTDEQRINRNLASAQLELDIVKAENSVREIAESFTKAQENRNNQQKAFDQQRVDLVQSAEEALGKIRESVENRIQAIRLQNIARENAILDEQAKNRINEAKSLLVTQRSDRRTSQVQRSVDPEVARVENVIASSFEDARQADLESAEKVAKIKRDAAFEVLNIELQNERFKLDTAKAVSDLQLRTARSIAKINKNVVEINNKSSIEKFNAEKKIAAIQVNITVSQLELYRALLNNQTQVSEKTKESIENAIDAANLAITQINNSQPPSRLTGAGPISIPNVSTSEIDQLQAKQIEAVNRRLAEQLKGVSQESANVFNQALVNVAKELDNVEQKSNSVLSSLRAEVERNARVEELVTEGLSRQLAERTQALEVQKELEKSVLRTVEAKLREELELLKGAQLSENEVENNEKIEARRTAINQKLERTLLLLGEIDPKYKQILETLKMTEDMTTELDKTFKSIGTTIENGIINAISSGIDALVTGTKTLEESLKEIASGVLKDIGRQLISFGVSTALDFAGSKGGFLGKLFGKASGGPVRARGTYLVGEKGPELLQMGSQGGFVQSNTSAAMRRYKGNGTGSKNSTMTVNYNVTEINGMKFVTEDQFREGLDQAAKNGAKMGQSMTISTLKNSRSQRSKIGL